MELKGELLDLFKEIEHGDQEHRDWLYDKMTEFQNRGLEKSDKIKVVDTSKVPINIVLDNMENYLGKTLPVELVEEYKLFYLVKDIVLLYTPNYPYTYTKILFKDEAELVTTLPIRQVKIENIVNKLSEKLKNLLEEEWKY